MPVVFDPVLLAPLDARMPDPAAVLFAEPSVAPREWVCPGSLRNTEWKCDGISATVSVWVCDPPSTPGDAVLPSPAVPSTLPVRSTPAMTRPVRLITLKVVEPLPFPYGKALVETVPVLTAFPVSVTLDELLLLTVREVEPRHDASNPLPMLMLLVSLIPLMIGLPLTHAPFWVIVMSVK